MRQSCDILLKHAKLGLLGEWSNHVLGLGVVPEPFDQILAVRVRVRAGDRGICAVLYAMRGADESAMMEVCPCGFLVFVSIFQSLFLFSVQLRIRFLD